jgi:hypothetical protein
MEDWEGQLLNCIINELYDQINPAQDLLLSEPVGLEFIEFLQEFGCYQEKTEWKIAQLHFTNTLW